MGRKSSLTATKLKQVAIDKKQMTVRKIKKGCTDSVI